MENYNTLFPDKRRMGETPLRQAQLVMLRMLKIIDHICRKNNIRYWLCYGTLLGAVRHQGFIPWDDDLDIGMPRKDYEQFIKIAQEQLPDDLFLQTRFTEKCYDSLMVPCKIRDKKSLIFAPYLEKKNYHQGIFIDIFPMDMYHKRGFKNRVEKCLKKINSFLGKCYYVDMNMDKQKNIKKFILLLNPLFYYFILSYQKVIQPIINKNKKLPEKEAFIGDGFELLWTRFFDYDDVFPLKGIIFEDSKFCSPNNPGKYLEKIYGPDYMTPVPIEKRVLPHSVRLYPTLDEIPNKAGSFL